MMDSNSVITHAAKHIVEKLSKEYEVTLSRMYEILGKDNPFPKAKRLIRAIARHNQPGARLIKADMDAMWSEILQPIASEQASLEVLHKESFEAIQACLTNKPRWVRAIQLRELIAVAQSMLEQTEKDDLAPAVSMNGGAAQKA